MLEYVETTALRAQFRIEGPEELRMFSEPNDPEGYRDSVITDDLISDVYLEFGERT